jgi:SP family general alpha glucoside:H+ symporter-like MFS transporter
MPEFKGRSYYELDILFERKVSARKFASTVVERDADEHNRATEGLPTH